MVDVTQAPLFKATEGLLSISANNFVGTFNTDLNALSLQSRDTSGITSNLTVHEHDSLNLVIDRWSQGGLVTNKGDISVTLDARDALLTLASGSISTGTSAGTITLVTDDIDFTSGADRVSGTGQLVIKTRNMGQGYLLGGAGQSVYGTDTSTSAIADGYMALGVHDLEALKDGFAQIQIGTAGSFMAIGDARDMDLGTVHFNGRFTDPLLLIADELVVKGNVQSTEAITTVNGRGFVRGQFFTEQGSLVASVCQEGVLRKRAP